MIDSAEFAGWLLVVLASILALCVVGYAFSGVKQDADEDEIVERRRLNLIVRWPK